jgi:hypothetical protein
MQLRRHVQAPCSIRSPSRAMQNMHTWKTSLTILACSSASCDKRARCLKRAPQSPFHWVEKRLTHSCSMVGPAVTRCHSYKEALSIVLEVGVRVGSRTAYRLEVGFRKLRCRASDRHTKHENSLGSRSPTELQHAPARASLYVMMRVDSAGAIFAASWNNALVVLRRQWRCVGCDKDAVLCVCLDSQRALMASIG